MPTNNNLIVDITAAPIARNAYIDSQRAAAREAAYQKSLNRKLPAVPWILSETEDEFRLRMQRDAEFWKRLLGSPDLLEEDRQKYNMNLNNALNAKYAPELIPGSSCIYTFTDNYGHQYRIPSIYKFLKMSDEDRAFTVIPLSELQPGDGVIDNKRHVLTYDSMGENGLPLYNHSNGGSDADSIKVKSYYTRTPLNDSQFMAIRFIGNKEDNERWNNEYNQYIRNYNTALHDMLKDVPIINLPKLEYSFPKLEIKR